MDVPIRPWYEIAGRIQRRIFQAPKVDPHIDVLGRTGSGKDSAIRWGILPAVPLARAVVLIMKPGGDRTWDGDPDEGIPPWGNVVAPEAFNPGFGCGEDGTPRLRIHLPPGRAQRDQVQRLLEQIAAVGEMIVVIGDAVRLTTRAKDGGLDLERHVSNLMSEGRENCAPVIACVNSTSWAASGVKDQAIAHLIGAAGGEARKRFAEIANLPADARGPLERGLAPHTFLYADQADGTTRACVASSPRPGWYDEAWPPAEQLLWPGLDAGVSEADVDRLRVAMRRTVLS